MKVIVIAAGRSKRLKPIEDKIFLKFLGKPMIQYQIEQLADAGFDDFILVGGAHNIKRLESLAGQIPHSITVIEQKNLDDGMAGAILSAGEVVKDGPALIVSGNDVVDQKAFQSAFDATNDTDFDGFLVAKEVDSYFPGGYLEVKDGLIQSIVEKPGEGNEPSNLVNLVLHFFQDLAPFLKALNENSSENDDRYEVALDALMKGGVKLKALPYDGFWQPVKYPWHILSLMDHFLETVEAKTDGADIAESAVIRGNVYLEDGVKVFDHATIVGPAYIGKGSIVANNALVRNSMIGEKSVVGYATEVARSYMGDGVWTHSNYIGDSILGNNVSFGAGSVTGNLRFDEGNINVCIREEKVDSGRNKFGLITGNHVRSGINTSFMPGVKIGNNVCVGAGVVIGQDIEDNKFVTGKTELKQHDNALNIEEINREEMQKKLS